MSKTEEKGVQAMRKITIEDDFDLEKIAFCGQCFRAKKFDDGMFRFITGNNVLYIKRENETEFSVSCTKEEWERIWHFYFDLSRDYKRLRTGENYSGGFVEKAVECGKGLRILRQDKWEMLITFIISQRKSIPAIAGAVEKLCERFGNKLETGYETLYSFPDCKILENAVKEDLALCGMGYRTDYIMDAVRLVANGEIDLERLSECGDEELFESLLKIKGVGKKVANCVLLFGYNRTARAPVDVWISRAIEEEFNGVNPFLEYGEDAGIIQQYIFFYEKEMNNTARY